MFFAFPLIFFCSALHFLHFGSNLQSFFFPSTLEWTLNSRLTFRMIFIFNNYYWFRIIIWSEPRCHFPFVIHKNNNNNGSQYNDRILFCMKKKIETNLNPRNAWMPWMSEFDLLSSYCTKCCRCLLWEIAFECWTGTLRQMVFIMDSFFFFSTILVPIYDEWKRGVKRKKKCIHTNYPEDLLRILCGSIHSHINIFFLSCSSSSHTHNVNINTMMYVDCSVFPV